jgi:hypothetical protein
VLLNKLLIYIIEKDDEIIEAFDDTLQSHAVGEKDDDRYPVLAQLVEKKVLKIMILALRHGHSLLLSPKTMRLHNTGYRKKPRLLHKCSFYNINDFAH